VQIILSTPQNLTTATISNFTDNLVAVLETGMVSALLVYRGEIKDGEYQKLLEIILPLSQPRNCATLLHNSAHLVRTTGADGVHISSGHENFIAAINLLKPQHIVGAGDITSRHQAMLAGEAGADYVCFGSIEGPIFDTDREMAQWWSKLFQTPCAVFDQQSTIKEMDFPASDFIGFGDNLWNIDQKAAQTLVKLKNSTGMFGRIDD